MASGWVVPLLAGVVAGLFASRVWGEWSIRRRPHQLAWATGLTLYALATLIDAYVSYQGGWSVPTYRLFFAVAAGNVGFLGLGTILLARSGWFGRAFGILVVIGALVAALGQFAVPLTQADLAGGSELGAKAIPFSTPARWAFLLLNVVGGLALIGGAILSWWQTRRNGVLLIGAGAMLPFPGGTLSTFFDLDVRVLLQFLGIAVMYVGYLRGREPSPPSAARAPSDA